MGGAGLQGDSYLAVAVVSAAHRQAFLPGLCGVLRNGCAVLHPNRSYRTANAVGSRQAYLSRSGGAGVPGTDHRRGHIGYPWTDEAIAVATKHRNVYIDTSAYTVDRYPPQLVDYLKHHGSQKVLFEQLSDDNAG